VRPLLLLAQHSSRSQLSFLYCFSCFLKFSFIVNRLPFFHSSSVLPFLLLLAGDPASVSERWTCSLHPDRSLARCLTGATSEVNIRKMMKHNELRSLPPLSVLCI
jgi:hypothetical protein